MFDFFKDVFFEASGIDSRAIAGERKNGYVVWECRCDCGNKILATAEQLTKGYALSCGCLSEVKNLTGMRFGRLTVICPTEERNDGSAIWHCKCACGNSTFVTTRSLTSGKTTSCGCARREMDAQGREEVAKDLTGERFGRLTVIRSIEERKSENEAKKKERIIFSRSAKVAAYVLGILYLIISWFSVATMMDTGSLNPYYILRTVFLVACDIAAMICLSIKQKKTEIAALILMLIFALTQYFTALLT